MPSGLLAYSQRGNREKMRGGRYCFVLRPILIGQSVSSAWMVCYPLVVLQLNRDAHRAEARERERERALFVLASVSCSLHTYKEGIRNFAG